MLTILKTLAGLVVLLLVIVTLLPAVAGLRAVVERWRTRGGGPGSRDE